MNKHVEVVVVMKRIVFFLALLILLTSHYQVDACVGRNLFIGALNAPPEQMLSEMLSVLINERTGTTVTIKYYDSTSELYDALKKNEVGILVENTDRAMEIVGNQTNVSGENAYSTLKEEYRNRLSLVWLESFGLLTVDNNKTQYYYGPVITEDVLVNFPALPRVINKLSGIINDKSFSKMIKSLESGEKPHKIARDFLKAKKLI
jgi:glycine betaine/choline ABC-type transport system substrate-binding protein